MVHEFVSRGDDPRSPPGIGSWLSAWARLRPGKEAVVDGSLRLTYGELDRRANRAARALLGLGLEPGDRLALLASNRVEHVELLMATAKAGLALVPLNVRLSAPELSFVLRDSGAKALVAEPELLGLAQAASAEVGPLATVVLGGEARPGAASYEALLAAESDGEPELPRPPGLGTPHVVVYTAGTSGRPKGLVLNQGASFWNAVNFERALDLTSADRNLVVLPLFHIGGMGLFTLPMLHVGGTVVLTRSFEPAEVLRLLRQERISVILGTPTLFLNISAEPGFRPSAFETVRVLMCGGAPLPPSLVRWYDREVRVRLRQGYGLSEAAPGVTALSERLAVDKAGSVGRPLPHVEARVVDEAMREVPRGRVGELVVRGPNVMQGYWGRPEATAEALAGGLLHTGDLARMDEDGDLWIVGRKEDAFVSEGEMVYPAEVEHAIAELPEVLEAAVLGVPDSEGGEAGRAIVALRPGRALDAVVLRDHLAARLGRNQVPKEVVFVDALPRNAVGKVTKAELRRR